MSAHSRFYGISGDARRTPRNREAHAQASNTSSLKALPHWQSRILASDAATDPIVAACTALHVCNCMPHVVLLSCTRLDCLRDSASGSQLYLLTPTQSPFCWYCTYSRSSQSEAVPRTVVCPPVGSLSCVSVGLSSPCRVGLACCIMSVHVLACCCPSAISVGPLTRLACMLRTQGLHIRRIIEQTFLSPYRVYPTCKRFHGCAGRRARPCSVSPRRHRSDSHGHVLQQGCCGGSVLPHLLGVRTSMLRHAHRGVGSASSGTASMRSRGAVSPTQPRQDAYAHNHYTQPLHIAPPGRSRCGRSSI